MGLVVNANLRTVGGEGEKVRVGRRCWCRPLLGVWCLGPAVRTIGVDWVPKGSPIPAVSVAGEQSSRAVIVPAGGTILIQLLTRGSSKMMPPSISLEST